MSWGWVIVVVLALDLLVAAEEHRAMEVRSRFGSALAAFFGFATRAAPLRIWAYGPPRLAFLVVFLGVGVGFCGAPAGFSLAAGFTVADKLITHHWLQLPGDTGWRGFMCAAGLLLLAFEPWAALAGVGALVSFLGVLWALGKVRR